ncbi:MAG: hypothetical protein F6J87_21845 [Spirulina sp. SIO3F2]|nr:hypothetical protein [Spirulina sp. SIO3F2]
MTIPESESIATSLFWSSLAFTILIYLLRGFGLLTFLPGGVIWLLVLLSVGMGVFYGVEKTRRF